MVRGAWRTTVHRVTESDMTEATEHACMPGIVIYTCMHAKSWTQLSNEACMHVQYQSDRHTCMLSRFSPVRLFATLWTVAFQAPLSVGFFRQEYWSGLPCPPPGDLPDPGIEPMSLTSPALAGEFFTISATWDTMRYILPFSNL